MGLKTLSCTTKTIKFNINIPQNIHNFHFCGAICAQSLILRFCAWSVPIFAIFPPPSEKWIDAAVCVCVCVCVCMCVCVGVYICVCV